MTLPNQPAQRPLAGRPAATNVPLRKPPASVVMALLMPEGVNLPPARRLVVLVPDFDLDEAGLSRRIWTLASPNQLAVLYLGLARSGSEEPRARRRLATLASLTRDDGVHVSTSLALEVNWLGALRPLMRSGDLIVCHSEQTLPGWRGARPLGNELCQALQTPLHMLNGFYAGDPVLPAHPIGRIIFWGGSVTILAAAFWLQVQISALPKNWAESALMVLSVVAECGLIGLWSRLFS